MGRFTVLGAACLFGCLHVASALPPAQVPLLLGEDEARNGGAKTASVVKKRPLQGRFLQITDFHPDRFYKVYTSTTEDNACHRGQGPAGIYGAESSDCDSPIALINQTMSWLAQEVRDQVDFVIWTGDSARHDNDELIPRNEKQVTGLNEFMVEKMSEVFGKPGDDDSNSNHDFAIPIIPTLGNNDILPHNILRAGPNKWLRSYARLWRPFIPEEQRHQFEQGGWFYVEAIPGKLAVFSLNTLYFFRSNAAVDGCAVPSEPGYEQLEWLRIRLQFLRDRGMKAIMTGHVPPTREESKCTWDETCWQKYTLWLRQYRDVVVASLYGHMNYDHFLLHDMEELRKGVKKGRMPNYDEPWLVEGAGDEDGEVHAEVSSSYFTDLRDRWSEFPENPDGVKWPAGSTAESGSFWQSLADMVVSIFKKKKKSRKARKEEEKFYEEIGGEYAERFAATFVAASVVPNLYPTFRIFEYNISGITERNEYDSDPPAQRVPDITGNSASASGEDDEDDNDNDITTQQKKYKFAVPDPPSKHSPPGPAYSPQPFSLIRYTQYLANLTHINNDFATNTSTSTSTSTSTITAEAVVRPAKWKEGRHKGKKPHDDGHSPSPKKFRFEMHYDTRDDDVYRLPDLTMPNLVALARRIGDFVPEDEMQGISGGDEVEVEKKKKMKMKKDKKKEKRKRKKERKEQRKINEAWLTFVRRAYVETLSREEIEEAFGS